LDIHSIKIYNAISNLPHEWDEVAHENAFLQTSYLKVLENSSPANMQCFYIGIFEKKTLIGVALAQYLDLNKLASFGDRDKCLKTYIRNFIFKKFASNVLFLGNNMMTGQNGYAFNVTIDFKSLSEILMECANEITKHFKKQNIEFKTVSNRNLKITNQTKCFR
jgi:predicted AAA+ superfamily ATPase